MKAIIYYVKRNDINEMKFEKKEAILRQTNTHIVEWFFKRSAREKKRASGNSCLHYIHL